MEVQLHDVVRRRGESGLWLVMAINYADPPEVRLARSVEEWLEHPERMVTVPMAALGPGLDVVDGAPAASKEKP